MVNSETFIISLDRTPERFKKTYEKLKSVGIEAKKFIATDGYNIKVTDLQSGASFLGIDLKKNYQINSLYEINCDPQANESVAFKWKGNLLTAGEIGLWCSNIGIWQYAKEQKLDYVVIFEDDIKPKSSDFKKQLSNFINKLPDDYDLAFIGHPDTHGTKINNYVLKPTGWWHGTYAYMISAKGLEKMLSYDTYFREIDLFFIGEYLDHGSPVSYLTSSSLVHVDTSTSVIGAMGR